MKKLFILLLVLGQQVHAITIKNNSQCEIAVEFGGPQELMTWPIKIAPGQQAAYGDDWMQNFYIVCLSDRNKRFNFEGLNKTSIINFEAKASTVSNGGTFTGVELLEHPYVFKVWTPRPEPTREERIAQLREEINRAEAAVAGAAAHLKYLKEDLAKIDPSYRASLMPAVASVAAMSTATTGSKKVVQRGNKAASTRKRQPITRRLASSMRRKTSN